MMRNLGRLKEAGVSQAASQVDSQRLLRPHCRASGSRSSAAFASALRSSDRQQFVFLSLIEAARQAGVGRFVFISTCAVHEKILDDRPLDESHPLWPTSQYGAHKAAIEKFVHSYDLGQEYPICALRPTGVYGVNRPVEDSKW